jgi:hypothetical protein
MYVGVLGSVATIAISALAEDKLRRYLLLGAIGLLCLFCFGLNEGILAPTKLFWSAVAIISRAEFTPIFQTEKGSIRRSANHL